MGDNKKSIDDPAKKPLDEREKLFVKNYLIHLNPYKAAKSAGYAESVCLSSAYQWVRPNQTNDNFKPHVYAAIQKAMDRRAKRIEITQDRVLEEYSHLAFVDIRDFYDDNGKLIPIHKLPDRAAAAISQIDITVKSTEEALKKIKTFDKKGALDSVARHLGMFNDKLGIGGVGEDGKITEIPIRFVDPPERDDET